MNMINKNISFKDAYIDIIIYEKNEEINSNQQLISSNIQRIGFTIYYYLHKNE